MLKVDRKYVDSIYAAVESTPQEQMAKLIEVLHEAMRLESSTIPPYYVAAWSIQDSEGYQNKKIRDLIASIAKEEMLHMMSIANIISATGAKPDINSKRMVLDWGTDSLPIGSNIIPSLAPFSMELLSGLFMEIEQPLNPVHYVVIQKKALLATEKHYATIGEFYDALIKLILSMREDPFRHGANYNQIQIQYDSRMNTIGHAPIENFQIRDREFAIKVIRWIVDQGEGSSEGPLDGDGAPAHYYRFAEIYMKGELMKDPSQPLGYAYDRKNHPINCDFTKVVQFAHNPKMKDFDPNSKQYKGLFTFNQTYMLMFQQLQEFYDTGKQQLVVSAVSSMNNMTVTVTRLLNLDPPVCPSFEWITT